MPDPLPHSPESTSERILQAALAVFLEVGFERANLEKVAAQAGVTKPTVYSHFGSKIGLLQAVAEQQARQALTQFSPSLKPTGNVRRDLTGFAKSFLINMLHPDAIRMHRFAIVEAMTHPELVAPLLNAGPQKLAEVLQNFLATETKAGRLCCKNPLLAAQQLIGLLTGMDFLAMVISQHVPSEVEIKKRISAAIDVFLNSYSAQEREHES
ncbi:MAG: TetR/AcrR family transcriptional regulator [Pirellula sp.]|jgi:TetR/AcrR family transcriptional repressor of mexJK operon|nr:TetR/AcrR family transcriptional regulator [Pirellula sp.]